MIAGIEYLVANWILYILLIPFMLIGYLLWDWRTSFRDSRREARRRQSEPKTSEADRDASGDGT